MLTKMYAALPVTSGVHDKDAGHKEDCPEISEPAPLQAIVAGDQQIEKTASLERPDPLVVTLESQQLATSAARLPYSTLSFFARVPSILIEDIPSFQVAIGPLAKGPTLCALLLFCTKGTS